MWAGRGEPGRVGSSARAAKALNSNGSNATAASARGHRYDTPIDARHCCRPPEVQVLRISPRGMLLERGA